MTTAPPDERPAILFVDDEEQARKYFRLAFLREFKVLTAGSVAEAGALMQAQGEQVGILITDQRMPGAVGVELLKQVRRDWPQTVRMLTTAYSDLDDAIAAVNRGEILRYITKPWDLDSLRADLRHGMEFYLLRRERDLLVEEKLSVRARAAHADRLCSLLAIAAGLDHLRAAPQALGAWARAAAATPPSAPLPAEAQEAWGLWARATRDLMALHRRLRALDATAAGGFPDLIEPAVLLADHGLAADGEAAPIRGLRAHLDLLIDALRPSAGAQVPLREASPGASGAPGQALALEFTGGGGGPVGEDLLSAYLIAWHHGGTLDAQLAPGGDGLRLRLILPRDPDSAAAPAPDADWIAQQFAALEP